jgi:hypothetical protein
VDRGGADLRLTVSDVEQSGRQSGDHILDGRDVRRRRVVEYGNSNIEYIAVAAGRAGTLGILLAVLSGIRAALTDATERRRWAPLDLAICGLRMGGQGHFEKRPSDGQRTQHR